MYIAYTSLICSLPFTFYSMGTLNGKIEAYNTVTSGQQSRRVDYSEIRNWQTISYIAEGISIGAGIWFGIELVRYLIAANDVLPEE